MSQQPSPTHHRRTSSRLKEQQQQVEQQQQAEREVIALKEVQEVEQARMEKPDQNSGSSSGKYRYRYDKMMQHHQVVSEILECQERVLAQEREEFKRLQAERDYLLDILYQHMDLMPSVRADYKRTPSPELVLPPAPPRFPKQSSVSPLLTPTTELPPARPYQHSPELQYPPQQEMRYPLQYHAPQIPDLPVMHPPIPGRPQTEDDHRHSPTEQRLEYPPQQHHSPSRHRPGPGQQQESPTQRRARPQQQQQQQQAYSPHHELPHVVHSYGPPPEHIHSQQAYHSPTRPRSAYIVTSPGGPPREYSMAQPPPGAPYPPPPSHHYPAGPSSPVEHRHAQPDPGTGQQSPLPEQRAYDGQLQVDTGYHYHALGPGGRPQGGRGPYR